MSGQDLTVQPAMELRERLARFNTSTDGLDEVLALFDAARATCPVSHNEQHGGFHTLLTYDLVRQAHTEWQTFSNAPQVTRPITERLSAPPLEYDPPIHGPWRDVVQQGINPRTAERVEAAVRADIAMLVGGFAGEGNCDLIRDFAERVPVLAICHVLGVDPEKGPEFQRLTTEMVANIDNPAGAADAFMGLAQFGIGEVMARREDPRDDYLTVLAQAEMDGQPLTPEQIAMTMFSVLAAGHETTVNALGFLLFEVLSRPDISGRLLEDPALIPAAVTESLRLHPPFVGFYRRAVHDTELGGTQIREGESVFLCWAAANRDPDAFPDPTAFRLDRQRGTKPHLSFGFGIHACPGQPLARMEMRVALEELLARLPDVALVDPAAVEVERNGVDNYSIHSLPARFAGR